MTVQIQTETKPEVLRVERLADRILQGDILLPKFQRDYVWDRGQIINLLDSIARGYPIGSILLWCTRAMLRSERNIADLEIQAPKEQYPVNYLLDGQQRLTTICGALFWTGTDPKSQWNIAYDLKTERFLHVDTLGELSPTMVRVNLISDGFAYTESIGAIRELQDPNKETWIRRGKDLYKRFKDYEIATVTLGQTSIKDVAPIFERVNSQGTELTIVDLMRAATWREDFDLVDSIREILKSLKEKGFSSLENKGVLRNISAAAHFGFTAENIDRLRDLSTNDLRTCVASTRDAYHRAIDFLGTHVKLADARMLPYQHQVTVLVEVFRQIPRPTADQYRIIEAWFWKTCLAEYFRGWNTGGMSRMISAINGFASGNNHALAFGFETPTKSFWIERAYRPKSAVSKLFTILLAQSDPVDLLTGQRIDVSQALATDNKKEFHHFFPKKYLSDQNTPREMINSLANFVFLTSASNKSISKTKPSEYLKVVANNAGTNLEAWLSSNMISKAAYEAALRDDYEAFLNARAQTIHNALLERLGSSELDAAVVSVEIAAGFSEESESDSLLDEEYTDEDARQDLDEDDA